MRRENKLALIVGFSVLLVVAVLVSDHLSKARQDEVLDGMNTLSGLPAEVLLVQTPLSAQGRIGSAGQIGDGSSYGRLDAPGQASDRGQSVAQSRPTRIETPADGALLTRGSDGDIATAGGEESGPLVIAIGQGAKTEKDTQGGISAWTGIDPEQVRKWLAGDHPTLAQQGSGESGTGRSSGSASETTGGSSAGGAGSGGAASSGAAKPGERPGGTSSGGNGYIARDQKYVIQKGDTLYEICERLYGTGTKWREVVAANKGKIAEDGTVFVGVTIDLPPGVKATGSAPVAGGRDSEVRTRSSVPHPITMLPIATERTRSYTVKKGDTLSQLVQREVGSVKDLDRVRALNPWLKDQKDNIRVGQQLVLPASSRSTPRGR